MASPSTRSKLQDLLDTVAFNGESSFRLCDREYQVHGQSGMIGSDDLLTTSLKFALYEQAFATQAQESPVTSGPAPDLTPALSKANRSNDRWDPGWVVLQVFPSGHVAARRNEVTRFVPGTELFNADSTTTLRSGSEISIYWKRESTTLQPGFYFAFGEAIPDAQDELFLTRFYWHIDSASAATLAELLTVTFNMFSVPFQAKFQSSTRGYARADAVVLYVAQRYFRTASELVARVYAQVKGAFKESTPLFARRLAPGLAFAEDPGNGESFGTYRCRLVAEAVVESLRQGANSTPEFCEAIERHFAKANLSLDESYLKARSRNDYLWPTF